MNNPYVLELVGVGKSFYIDNAPFVIIENASIAIKKGEIVAFVGRSGLGKSTVLQICGLLDSYSSGEVFICGVLPKNDKDATYIRRKNIGFVHQFHHLFIEFNVIENLMIPLMLNGVKKPDAQKKAMTLLEKISMDHLHKSNISSLSGGERQRIAVVRSIVHNPKIVIADEPTGSLDPNTAKKIFDMLITFVKDNNASLLVATHNLDLAKNSDYIITIEDRKLCRINIG